MDFATTRRAPTLMIGMLRYAAVRRNRTKEGSSNGKHSGRMVNMAISKLPFGPYGSSTLP